MSFYWNFKNELVWKRTSLLHCRMHVHVGTPVTTQTSLFARGVTSHRLFPLKLRREDELEGQVNVQQALKNKTVFCSWMFLLFKIWYEKVKKWQVVFGWRCDYVFSGQQSLSVCDYVMQPWYW
jgi:hypothetical protein